MTLMFLFFNWSYNINPLDSHSSAAQWWDKRFWQSCVWLWRTAAGQRRLGSRYRGLLRDARVSSSDPQHTTSSGTCAAMRRVINGDEDLLLCFSFKGSNTFWLVAFVICEETQWECTCCLVHPGLYNLQFILLKSCRKTDCTHCEHICSLIMLY